MSKGRMKLEKEDTVKLRKEGVKGKQERSKESSKKWRIS